MAHREGPESPSSVRAPRPLARRSSLLLALAHLLPVLWLFGGTLTGSRLPYFRDLSSQYAPDYEFLSRALAQGVWPLFNPYVDGGSPCLFVYPVDLVVVGVFGARAPLGLGVAVHLFLALCGGSWLARRLGQGMVASWAAGTVYGLSGFVLSLVNLMQLFHAAAWAPFVLGAFVRLLDRPGRREARSLAVFAALQASTLGAEILLQTALIGLVLWTRRTPKDRAGRTLVALGGAGVVAALLAAPALLGLAWLLEGSARGRGFSVVESLTYSVAPRALLEVFLPRFFGNVHAFADLGYWGQPFHPQGFPYLLSLYLGPIVLIAALAARPGPLHVLVALSLLASLGRYGPLGTALAHALPFMRGPVKFFFTATLAGALLVGEAFDRSSSDRFRRPLAILLVAAGVSLAALGVVVAHRPGAASFLWAGVPAEVASRASEIARLGWSGDFVGTGCLGLAAGLLLLVRPRQPWLAASMILLDLLTVNGALNPLAASSFYALRPAMAEAVREAEREGRFRVFSYGATVSRGLRWNAAIAALGSDEPLFAADRQALVPRAQELDGLEGAFDGDRTGWAPSGATLRYDEAFPAHFAQLRPRLRLANVRFIFSFEPLPEDAVTLRRSLVLAELESPLLLYELRDVLPRAFWIDVIPESPADVRPGSAGLVRYRRLDPHTVQVDVKSPPGRVVWLDFFHRDWRGAGAAGPLTIEKVLGHYSSVATPGGRQTYIFRFSPRWPSVSVALCGVGLLGLAAMGVAGRRTALDTVEPAR